MESLYTLSNSELEEMGITVCPCISAYQETYNGQTYDVCNDCGGSSPVRRADTW